MKEKNESIINRLYRGELSPYNDFPRGSEASAAFEEYLRAENALAQRLTSDSRCKELMAELISAGTRLHEIGFEEKFREGFCLGVKFMSEATNRSTKIF